MQRFVKLAFSIGCLSAIVGPLLALLLYPRAKWLFALVFLGFALLWLNARLAKDPAPSAVADEMERLLTGHFGGWDVDDFESRRIRDPRGVDQTRRRTKTSDPPNYWRTSRSRRAKIEHAALTTQLSPMLGRDQHLVSLINRRSKTTGIRSRA